MKTHLNLGTSDLDRSRQFYEVLLGTAPVKQFDDYVLFVTDQPPLELALDPLPHAVRPVESAHYGIAVDATSEVDAAIARLRDAGFATDEQNGVCCYAWQDKVWATDPDGRRWEVYVVLEETPERDGPDADCCRSEGEARSCCAASG